MHNVQAFERREYQQVKANLHRKILDRLDLEKLGRTPSNAAREEVLLVIRNTVNSEAVPLSFTINRIPDDQQHFFARRVAGRAPEFFQIEAVEDFAMQVGLYLLILPPLKCLHIMHL